MDNQKLKRFARSLVIIPFLATSIPFSLNVIGQGKATDFGAMNIKEEILLKRAEKIDSYFEDRGMPLNGLGEKFASEASRNNLDWRLLPAIAIRESSGGKYACGNNPFGWASCKQSFDSFEEATEIVAKNLGGKNPKTVNYYGARDTREKLRHYNGTVIRTYPEEVIAIMEKIGDYE